MPGGWTYYDHLTPYDSFVFYNAIGNHEDYSFYPVAVAKQVVNGTNYRYLCIAEPKKQWLYPFFAMVEIYKPLDGTPYATRITHVG